MWCGSNFPSEGLVLVCGDFNPTSTRITELATKRVTGLSQIIKVPTRDTETLDWCLTNRPKLMASPKQLPKLGRSDHYTILINSAQSPSVNRNTNKTIEKQDLRPSRMREFGWWMVNQSWEEVLSARLVSDKYNLFMDKLSAAVEKFLPVRSFRTHLSDKPWISTKIKALVLKRQRCLHKFGKDSDRFKEIRNAVQRECKRCKKSFYDNKVAKLKQSNIKRWWDEVKSLSGVRSVNNWVQQVLCDQLPSVEALANRFNEFLGSLTADFTPLPSQPPGQFFTVPEHLLVDNNTVYKSLCQIKSNKSAGPDPIPGRVWKEFALELAPIVMDIYNASMYQGYVPQHIKQSHVVPVPKCSPPKSVEQDLRPISLTSHLSKIMEGFTLQPLFDQVCEQLDANQFALAGKSTTHALVYLLHAILQSLDEGHSFARIFFADFSKGFDLVDHNALVLEMQRLGVHEASIRWISSFLTDRVQRVKIEGVYSDTITPRGGIPQGTKLAPLLFAILVNRLCQDWPNRIKYVDDTSVFEIIPRCSPSYLPLIAADINNYASQRNMRLNEKKCKEMVISFLKYQPFPVPPMLLNGAVIARVVKFKLLGVTLSNDLSWNDHCDEMLKKAYKRLYPLRSLKAAGLEQNDLVLVYCSLVRSVVEYASPVWAALPKYLDDLLESVQKKAFYIIFGHRDYVKAMETAGLQTLSDRRDEACRQFIAKARQSPPLKAMIPSPSTRLPIYNLRVNRPSLQLGRTNRFNNLVTVKYQHVN